MDSLLTVENVMRRIEVRRYAREAVQQFQMNRMRYSSSGADDQTKANREPGDEFGGDELEPDQFDRPRSGDVVPFSRDLDAIRRYARGVLEKYSAQYDDSKHPRGQPDNAGQFAATGSSEATVAGKPKKPRLPQTPKPAKAPSHDDDSGDDGGSTNPKSRFYKAPPIRAEMHSVTRIDKDGKPRLVMADGTDAPAHVQSFVGEIPPTAKEVMIATDPKAEVLATYRNEKHKSKTVYSGDWNTRTAAAKFSRAHDMNKNKDVIYGEFKNDRQNLATKENADVSWLMYEQGTRPGSEADNKDMGKFYGKKLSSDDVIVTKGGRTAKGKEKPSTVQIKCGGQAILIKDKKTKAELIRRKEAGEPLMDSTYWLKSHGATTLEGRHIVPTKDGVRLQFVGKESVWHDHLIRDPELGKMLLERKKASGETGKLFNTDEKKVRKYVFSKDGGDFLTKDLRTARANLLALDEIRKETPPKTDEEYKQKTLKVGTIVSNILGNEPERALESYIDKTLFSSWVHGLQKG